MVAHANNNLVATTALEGPGVYSIDDGSIIHGSGARPIVCHQYDRFPRIVDFAMKQNTGGLARELP